MEDFCSYVDHKLLKLFGICSYNKIINFISVVYTQQCNFLFCVKFTA